MTLQTVPQRWHCTRYPCSSDRKPGRNLGLVKSQFVQCYLHVLTEHSFSVCRYEVNDPYLSISFDTMERTRTSGQTDLCLHTGSAILQGKSLRKSLWKPQFLHLWNRHRAPVLENCRGQRGKPCITPARGRRSVVGSFCYCGCYLL